jgi:hypothetical protein
VRYNSTDWSLEVPDGWSGQEDEDCATFCHSRGVGAFQVSSYRKDELVTDDDLRKFAGDIPLTAVSSRRLTGFYSRFSKDGTFWAKWWLRAGQQMIHATYNCPLADRSRDDAEVSAMILSLTPEYDQPSA